MYINYNINIDGTVMYTYCFADKRYEYMIIDHI